MILLDSIVKHEDGDFSLFFVENDKKYSYKYPKESVEHMFRILKSGLLSSELIYEDSLNSGEIQTTLSSEIKNLKLDITDIFNKSEIQRHSYSVAFEEIFKTLSEHKKSLENLDQTTSKLVSNLDELIQYKNSSIFGKIKIFFRKLLKK